MHTHLYIVAGLALVIGFAGGHYFGNKGPHMEERKEHRSGEYSMHGQMDDMTASLSGKTGDEFDKAFLEEMIVHHEGAVDMANMALASAGHEEIKTMSREIIDAQTKEIATMKEWLSAWYGE